MTHSLHLDRRSLLKALALTGAAAATRTYAQTPSPLPPWTPGHFDIHHIDTARGNATLLIFPDRTSLLIDAGSVISAAPGTLNPARPNATTLSPGEVLADYLLAHTPTLDYFLATHIHGDHVEALPDVVAHLPITTFIDRAFPHYASNQLPPTAPYAQAYLDFLHKQGPYVQAARIGSTTQIVPHTPVPNFSARILAANGNVWNPHTRKIDPLLTSLPAATDAHGNENLFSIATRFKYGHFSYYTGGDLTCDTEDGRHPLMDIESPVARAAGRTEVAVANHHGYFDACGPTFTRALDAQAYIIPSWDIGHPGSAQMQRLTGIWNTTGSHATHDVFALELLPQNALLNRRFAPQLKSRQGHVIVRVAPGGDTYTIFVTDSTVTHGNITATFGPYTCRT